MKTAIKNQLALLTGSVCVLADLIGLSAVAFAQSPGLTVMLTNPLPDAIFSSPATIRMKASAIVSESTIVRVQFYESTNLLGTVTQPPYNLTNVLLYRLQYYFLTAMATDDQGITSTSSPVRILVAQDPLPPRVYLTGPKDGAVFSSRDSVQMTASVIDFHGGVKPVHFFSGSNFIGSADAPLYTDVPTNFPDGEIYTANYYSLSVSNPPLGQQTLTAKYRDVSENPGMSAGVHITVSPLLLSRPSMSPAGQFRFTVEGLSSGKNFEIQDSSDLVSWYSIATNFAASNIMDFIENTPTNANARYYRVLQNLQ